MLTTSVSVDLITACDRAQPTAARSAAWGRYEVECWYRAFKERGLLIRYMDNDRTGLDGESMQLLVTRRLNLPEASGIVTGAH